MSVSKTSNTLMQENVHFHDQNESWKVDVSTPGFESSYESAMETDVTLANFLARPVKIFSSDWATSNPAYADTFNPWQNFFTNAAVKNKLRYYHNVRCRLHLKFVINGNPFLFGRVVAAYTPLHSASGYPVLTTNIPATATRATCRPHIFIDPTTSQAGEMVLPFFWYYNYFRVPNIDWIHAGIIDLMAMARLKHANGATMSTRITVFAWAEDVSLTAPTNVLGALTSQSGVTGDEYDRKPSTIATTMSTMAGMLSNVPVIGPYARASSMVLGKLGDAARIFGYSRPIETAVGVVRPVYTSNLANTNVPDTTMKLSTDVKQEVTIDSRTVGMDGTDEMTIQSIACRSAYLFTIPWTFSTAAGTKIGSLGVTPYLASRYTIASIPVQQRFNLLPCGHAAMPFRNWRGTMKYRFQIVASNYHKGRIVVQYDPHDSNVHGYNTAYNRVVDISEERDFTIEVGWNTPALYLDARDFSNEGDPFAVGATNIVYHETYLNGQLSIWVVNELTAPAAGEVDNDISILVFASCGDDIEFQNPTSAMLEAFTFHPVDPPTDDLLEQQSGVDPVVADDLQNTTNPLEPITTNPDSEIGKTIQGDSKLADVCFGERIVSFRSLIKRFALHELIPMANDRMANTSQWYFLQRIGPAFPSPRGLYATGVHSSTDGPYGYFKTPLISYLARGFAGRRGGIRLKFAYFPLTIPGSSNVISNNVFQYVTRLTQRYNPEVLEVWSPSGATLPAGLQTNTAASLYRVFPSGPEGVAMQPALQNPVLEVEVPWASPYRFAPSQHDPALSKWDPGYEYKLLTFKQASTNGALVHKYVAAADDFSFFFYIGCPPCANQGDPTPVE